MERLGSVASGSSGIISSNSLISIKAFELALGWSQPIRCSNAFLYATHLWLPHNVNCEISQLSVFEYVHPSISSRLTLRPFWRPMIELLLGPVRRIPGNVCTYIGHCGDSSLLANELPSHRAPDQATFRFCPKEATAQLWQAVVVKRNRHENKHMGHGMGT